MSFVFQRMLSTDKAYYRLDEVAQAFGVSKSSVQRWMTEGRLPYCQTPGGHRRIPREALMAASPNYIRQ